MQQLICKPCLRLLILKLASQQPQLKHTIPSLSLCMPVVLFESVLQLKLPVQFGNHKMSGNCGRREAVEIPFARAMEFTFQHVADEMPDVFVKQPRPTIP